MKTIYRDNPPVNEPRIFTAMTCEKCGEMYEADRIHICGKRNSYPDVSKDTIIKRPKDFMISGNKLINLVERYCDSEDKIRFEDIYFIVSILGKEKTDE